MTATPRILGIAACLLVLSSGHGLAAGKRKTGVHKMPTPVHATPVKGTPPTTVEPAPSRGSTAPADVRAGEARTPLKESVRQESRIEFDERMLRGQSAAGVIYLFQRTPSDWKSIVQVPDSFRSRTVQVLSSAEEKK
jgi:hypothetical protein